MSEMNMYIVGCKSCDIEFSWLWDEKVAIEQWNTRKPIEKVVKKLEKMKKVMESKELYETAVGYRQAIQIVKGSEQE